VTRQRSSHERRAGGERRTSNDAHESRAERKEHTRQTLLTETLALLEDRSLASLSLREVARAAGIVPTAFYRHFDSMDDLGVALVDVSFQSLRQAIRQARRDPLDHPIRGTVDILVRAVRGDEAAFRFLSRERNGGVPAVARAIAEELRQFRNELTIDLARIPQLLTWGADDLEMVADLMVNAMLGIVADLLAVDPARAADQQAIIAKAERQLRVIVLGMGAWMSSSP